MRDNNTEMMSGEGAITELANFIDTVWRIHGIGWPQARSRELISLAIKDTIGAAINARFNVAALPAPPASAACPTCGGDRGAPDFIPGGIKDEITCTDAFHAAAPVYGATPSPPVEVDYDYEAAVALANWFVGGWTIETFRSARPEVQARGIAQARAIVDAALRGRKS